MGHFELLPLGQAEQQVYSGGDFGWMRYDHDGLDCDGFVELDGDLLWIIAETRGLPGSIIGD